MVTFKYDNKRAQVLEFPFLLSSAKSISLLSSPLIVENENIFSIMNCFTEFVWFLILLSYLIYLLINIKSTEKWKQILYLAIDYLVIFLGRGMKNIIELFLYNFFSIILI